MAAGKAYRASGYSGRGAVQSAAKLLTNAHISSEVARLRKLAESDSIATVKERKEFLTEGMRGAHELDRLKSVDILNKMDGVYDDKEKAPPNITVVIGGNAE